MNRILAVQRLDGLDGGGVGNTGFNLIGRHWWFSFG
jgi:hypothetical protein